ncbi:protein phosphatase 2C [Histomonas meleagridis]|uniref:protein phosphatase 2C n=1 Tax=Histomonas meleagridis TaxID=135588 RepID=UPI00355A126B|nr:protein phosphatase 2C [Histomonas meleagridis]KAH0797141.1 protein phosphatase 2C [Histomonas meleagridis]
MKKGKGKKKSKNDNSQDKIDEAIFLDPLPEYFFADLNTTCFEAFSKRINEIPIKGELMLNVTKVRFSACQLSKLPPGLTAYTNIQTLILTDNKFTGFPHDELAVFTCLTTLDLSSNLIQKLDVELPQSLQSLDLSFNPFDVTSIWDKDLPNLQVLKLSSCEIESIPNTLPKWKDSLISLYLNGNNLREIPSILSQFPVLEYVNIFGNQIISFDQKAVGNNIKTLDLSLNDISEFSYDEPFSLQSLYIKNNLITRFPLKTLEIVGIKLINLTKCQIEGVLDFKCPPTLVAFELSNNRITGVTSLFASSTSNLGILDLAHNNIGELPEEFPIQNRLVHLILDDNKLEKLPKNLLQSKAIETLSCSNNKLIKLGKFDLPKLKILNLSFNRIQYLSDSFSSSIFLTEINVSFNLIDELPSSLSLCRKMMVFNGSVNQFRRFPSVLLSFPQLKSLSISGNLLSVLPKSISSLRFLKNLNVSNNHIKTIPPEIISLRQLTSFSASHNLIEDIPPLPDELIFLDLSFNKLNKFSVLLPKLQSLNLEFNQLSQFDFRLIPLTKYLSLSMNNFTNGLVDMTSEAIRAKSISCLEYVGNKYDKAKPLPPVRLHVMDNNHFTFPMKFGIGYASTMGDRLTMEDAILIRQYDENHSLFGVFDGHTGNASALSAADLLFHDFQKIISNDNFAENYSQAFVRINQVLKQLNVKDGCTAAVAVISEKRVYSIGVGDSRVVRVKRHSAERITTDFKPLDRPEYKRLRSNGLTVTPEGRINRKLAVARSLGDFWCGEGLFVKPDVEVYDICKDDVAIIMACDGVWDVIDEEYAARVVRASKSASDAAISLRNYAYALGSKDNISVIVVSLRPEEGTEGICDVNDVEELSEDEVSSEDEGMVLLPTPTRARWR